jgi:GH24 family phage-related lysozyme (muramidase)
MTPETKLKVAAEEIKEVLRKHDIAAGVVLHTPGHGEYFVHLNPSYSCAYICDDDKIIFHSKRADYKTPEEQIEKVTATANMLRILTEISVFNFGILEHLSNTFDKLANATHLIVKK